MPGNKPFPSMHPGEAPGVSGTGDRPVAKEFHGMDADPENAFGHLQRGRQYMRIGMIDRALRDFDIAIRIAPENPAAFILRATAHAVKKNHKKALADFTRAIELRPDDGTAWIGRAHVHAMLNREKRALRDMAMAGWLE